MNQITTANQRPIVPMGIVMIPFRDPNLDPNKIACYTPAVVVEICGPDRMVVYEANGPRNPHDSDPRECYPLSLKGQLLNVDGAIIRHYSTTGRQNDMVCIYRYLSRVVGAVGINQFLSREGEWVVGGRESHYMHFKNEQAANDYIKANLPEAALSRPFKVGDRVRTLKSRINSRDSNRFSQLTGTIKHLTHGYGWATCQWDEACNPNRYANPDVYASNNLELIEETLS